MDLLVVVSAQLFLLLFIPGTERNTNVARGILATNHEPDLSRGIAFVRYWRDTRGYVGIVVYAYSTTGKTFKHAFLRSFMMSRWSHWHSATESDERNLEVRTLGGDNAAFAKGAEEQLEIRFLEESFRWSFRIGASIRRELVGGAYESVMMTSNEFL